MDELPAPKLRPGSVLVRNVFSLISAGTERTSVETAQASMVQKARLRPDLARRMLDNVNREGLLDTYTKVQDHLDNFKEPRLQGGRIIGAGGQFVDVTQFLCGALPTSVHPVALTDSARRYNKDNILVTIAFADGSAGTIHYLANGANAVEKEYLEVFGDQKTARMWNFKKMESVTPAGRNL